MAERIVLFGGTFDPVHHGHLIIARSVAEQCGFERVTLLPSANPPHKAAAAAPAEDRLEMLRLATRGDELFEASGIELGRSGPSYTIDTVDEVLRDRGEAAQVVMVIGADMLEELPEWRRSRELLEKVTFAVAGRLPWGRQLESVFERLSKTFPADRVRALRASVVSTPLIEISSTQVRRRVSEGRSIRYLVPEAVQEHILSKGLYAGPATKGTRNEL